jgi:signal transduction histidine kinase
VFRAAAEALTNVRKHAGATTIEVTVRSDAEGVEVVVEDDGNGAKAIPGLGLTTTRERVETLGGELEVESNSGRGTRFRIGIPSGAAG